MTDPAADAERAAAHVVDWGRGAASALSRDKLTPTERARLGDLLLSAATWLDERAARHAKIAAAAAHRAFLASIAHLSHDERLKRIARGQ